MFSAYLFPYFPPTLSIGSSLSLSSSMPLLFWWQLCKPASLWLHTDRAIFSRHLISVGLSPQPQPFGPSVSSYILPVYQFASPSVPFCHCHLLLVSLLVIVMAFLNVIFHLAHTFVKLPPTRTNWSTGWQDDWAIWPANWPGQLTLASSSSSSLTSASAGRC